MRQGMGEGVSCQRLSAGIDANARQALVPQGMRVSQGTIFAMPVIRHRKKRSLLKKLFLACRKPRMLYSNHFKSAGLAP